MPEENLQTLETEQEIRIAEHAIVCAVARAVGLEANGNAYALMLAQIKEQSVEVHDVLLAFIAGYRTWLWRQRQAKASGETPEAIAKVLAAANVRDRYADALATAIAKYRGTKNPQVPLTPNNILLQTPTQAPSIEDNEPQG